MSELTSEQIEALEQRENAENFAEERESLRKNRDSLLAKVYAALSPMDIVKVARHPDRPQTSARKTTHETQVRDSARCVDL